MRLLDARLSNRIQAASSAAKTSQRRPVTYAGAASGLLATAQQVVGALGVAIIGIVFCAFAASGSADPRHITWGFEGSLVILTLSAVLTAVTVLRIPSRAAREESRN